MDEHTVDIILGRTCELYGLHRAAIREPDFAHAPPGMKKALRLHQLWAVARVLSSMLDRGIATALLADEMGPGTTATALGVTVVSHRFLS